MEQSENTLFAAPACVQSDRILYTPSAFARTSLLHLQEAGTLKALQPIPAAGRACSPTCASPSWTGQENWSMVESDTR